MYMYTYMHDHKLCDNLYHSLLTQSMYVYVMVQLYHVHVHAALHKKHVCINTAYKPDYVIMIFL